MRTAQATSLLVLSPGLVRSGKDKPYKFQISFSFMYICFPKATAIGSVIVIVYAISYDIDFAIGYEIGQSPTNLGILGIG